MWWIKRKLQSEGLTYRPPSIELRKETQDALEAALRGRSEADVRQIIEAINGRIREANRKGIADPSPPLAPFDVERIVDKWHGQGQQGGHTERDAASRQAADSLGSEAARLDRARPRYPVALIERIVAGATGARILDVGTATGIVVRQFQAAGARCSGSNRTHGWPSSRGEAACTSRSRASKRGMPQAGRSTRSSRARAGTGCTGRGSGEGGRGAPDRWSAGRVLEHRAAAGGPRGTLCRDLPPMLAGVDSPPASSDRRSKRRMQPCARGRPAASRRPGPSARRSSGGSSRPSPTPATTGWTRCKERRRDSREPVARPAGTHRERDRRRRRKLHDAVPHAVVTAARRS